MNEKLRKPCGMLGVPMECTFACIRTEETNSANFIADLTNWFNKSDVTIFNSGSLRIDEVIPDGILRMKDVIKLLPMHDPMVVLKGTGK